MTYHTGRASISLGTRDILTLGALVTAGILAALYYADYWFLGGHRKQIVLFVILSYAIFRGVARGVFSWACVLFASFPRSRPLPRELAVDVLTTAMPGEPYEMFEQTLAAIQNMRYPHQTYLLDGGNDQRLRLLCDRLGVHHIDARGIEGAKAGKVNFCLRHHARGDFVLIIDPDHIPEPDFLDRTLGQFSDERVGFVQAVQAYYNVNRSLVSRAAAEQTYGFYGPTMIGLNGMGIPLAIGANCLFRRAALDSIGGHAESLAEDVNTSLRIHAAGWKSVYVPYRASYGLAPEELHTFFKQQLKWSKGMFSLFFGEYWRLFWRLPLQAKLYYFFAGTFYLHGLVTALTIALPIIFLFAKIFAVEMPLDGFLVHLTPYVVMTLAINQYLQRWYSDPSERVFPYRTMVLEKGTWYVYSLGLVYALMGRNVLYLPTPKSPRAGRAVRLVVPHMAAVALSAAAIAFTLLTYQRIDQGTVLMIFFASVNIVILTPTIAVGLRKTAAAGDQAGQAAAALETARAAASGEIPAAVSAAPGTGERHAD